MTQHNFSTTLDGSRILVIMGWHRPLGHFIIIERNPPDETKEGADAGFDDDGCILYSNLNDPADFGMEIGDIKKKLTEFGISVPNSMFEQIARDQAMNIENRQVCHHVDGSFQELREACCI
jgi:hypothetical protein